MNTTYIAVMGGVVVVLAIALAALAVLHARQTARSWAEVANIIEATARAAHPTFTQDQILPPTKIAEQVARAYETSIAGWDHTDPLIPDRDRGPRAAMVPPGFDPMTDLTPAPNPTDPVGIAQGVPGGPPAPDLTGERL